MKRTCPFYFVNATHKHSAFDRSVLLGPKTAVFWVVSSEFRIVCCLIFFFFVSICFINICEDIYLLGSRISKERLARLLKGEMFSRSGSCWILDHTQLRGEAFASKRTKLIFGELRVNMIVPLWWGGWVLLDNFLESRNTVFVPLKSLIFWHHLIVYTHAHLIKKGTKINFTWMPSLDN